MGLTTAKEAKACTRSLIKDQFAKPNRISWLGNYNLAGQSVDRRIGSDCDGVGSGWNYWLASVYCGSIVYCPFHIESFGER